MDEPAPWTILPDLDPEAPDSHSIGESYILLDWLRCWQAMTPEAKAAFLDRTDATPAWRRAIVEIYEHYPVDVLAPPVPGRSSILARLRALFGG